MPNIENTLPDNILNLIKEPDLQYTVWKPDEGHYMRVTLENDNGKILNHFRSDTLWDGTPIYQNSEGVPYYDVETTSEPVCGGTQYGEAEISCDNTKQDWADVLQVPYYKDSQGNIFVKPNDILEKDPRGDYGTGKYKFTFHFVQDLWDTETFNFNLTEPRFLVKEISTSRKEIRLLSKHTDGEDDNASWELTEDFFTAFENTNLDENGKFDANLFILNRKQANLTRAINYAFDEVSFDKNSLILKFNNAVPNLIKVLDQIQLVRQIWSSQTQEVTYFEAYHEDPKPSYLTIGNLPDSEIQLNDDAESYNQIINDTAITSTQKTKLLENIFSSSLDVNNIDYSSISNHTHFGSAEHKIKNFYSKVKKIEDYYSEISTSLGEVTSSTLDSTFTHRKNLFTKIDNTILGFTPFEKWMYYDFESTASFPNAGRDYSKVPAITGSFNENFNSLNGNGEVLTNFEGINLVYKVSTVGDNVVVSSSFDTGSFEEDIHDYWYTGSSTANWRVDRGKLETINAGSTQNPIYQITASEYTTAGEQLGLAPFESGKNYVVEFQVVDKEANGDLTFQLGYGGNGNYTGGSKTFTITSTGYQKGEIANTNIYQEGDNTAGQNGDNVLAIFANEFSGSIDNLTVRRAMDNQDGRADIFTNKYRVEDYPMSSHNGKFFLSFLAKWQENPEWENSNLSGSFNIPPDCLNQEYIVNPTANMTYTGSWHRYIYAASQSYWRPAENSGLLTDTTAQDTSGNSFEILSGSSITGSYEIDSTFMNTFTEPYVTYENKSVMPVGELFRVYHVTSSDDNAPLTSSLITDVKIFTEDTLYSASYSNATGSITDVIPFSHLYSTSSQIVQDWYSSSLAKAKDYDSNNIHSLFMNLPRHVREEDENKLIQKIMSLMGDQYDVLKNYIDNYLNINSRDYDPQKAVPDLLLKNIGDNFGWSFINSNSFKNLLEYYVGEETAGLSYKDVTSTIWRHILNNLIYIYKSKGTENSVRALLSTFGIPPDLLTVSNVVSSDSQAIQSSPGLVNLESASLRSVVGDNYNYQERKEDLHLLNFDSNNNRFSVPFTGDRPVSDIFEVDSTGLSFIFSTSDQKSTQDLLHISGVRDQHMWKVSLVPSQSGHWVEWSFNTQLTGSLSSSFVSHSISVPTLHQSDNRKLWHLQLQQTEISADHTGSYTMRLAHRGDDSDKIDNFYSSSFTLTGSLAKNYKDGVPPLAYHRFRAHYGTSFTGSIGMISSRSGSLDVGAFFNGVFNFNNTSNGSSPYGFEEINYRYDFKQLGSNSTTQQISKRVTDQFPNNVYPLNQDLSSGIHSFTTPSIRKQTITTFRFNPRNINLSNNRSTKTVNIGSSPNIKSNGLSLYNNNLINEPDRDEFGNIKQKPKSVVKFGLSPSSLFDNFLTDNFSDVDMGQLLATPSDFHGENYTDLDTLRNKFYDTLGKDFIDINDFNRRMSKIFPKNLWDALREILPENVEVDEGITLENVSLHRNKIGFGTGGGSQGAEAGIIEFSTTEFTNFNTADSALQETFVNTNGDEVLDVGIGSTEINEPISGTTHLEDEVGMSGLQQESYESNVNFTDELQASLDSQELYISPESTIVISDNTDINSGTEMITISEGSLDQIYENVQNSMEATSESSIESTDNISYENEYIETSIFNNEGDILDFTFSPSDEINLNTSNSEAINENSFVITLSENKSMNSSAISENIIGDMTEDYGINDTSLTGNLNVVSEDTVPTIDTINMVSQIDEIYESNAIETPGTELESSTDSTIEGSIDTANELVELSSEPQDVGTGGNIDTSTEVVDMSSSEIEIEPTQDTSVGGLTENYATVGGDVFVDYSADVLDVQSQVGLTENTQVSTVDTATALSISNDNYIPSGEVQSNLQGNTTDSNTNFDSVIGTNMQQEIIDKYVHRGSSNNDNFAKLNPYTLKEQSYFEERGAISEFIGDTEIISSRTPKQINVKVKTQGGWSEGHKMFEYEDFDTSNSNHFKNSEQGRTSRVDINYTTGEITYPDNWIGHHIDKRLIEEQAKGTIETGENLTHNDPTGQLKSENKNGAIWSVDVGGTGTSNRLKVEP